MPRRVKLYDGWDFPPIRLYWQAVNRKEREAKAQQRLLYKARDKRRSKCRCKAYPWPHRPAGGLCRYPDPPVECWQRKPGSRPYGSRYAGLRRQIARANGLHPIRDRAVIDALAPEKLPLAKELHRQRPKYKYRNMEMTTTGMMGNWQTVGPMM